jgi:hypothetical protein
VLENDQVLTAVGLDRGGPAAFLVPQQRYVVIGTLPSNAGYALAGRSGRTKKQSPPNAGASATSRT